ncbi:MAG: Dabb family protein [Clostridia bacterium]|nr:Dabb family protein [Clostridia bacterium]
MIKHIVLFKLKNPDEANIAAAKEKLMSMQNRVEEIMDIEVGVDFLHSERSYDIALIVLLKDRDALNAYQTNPYHCGEVRVYMRSVAASSVTADYDI